MAIFFEVVMTEKELFKAVYRIKRLSRSPRTSIVVSSEICKLHNQCKGMSIDVLKRVYGCAAISLLIRDLEDPLLDKYNWRKLIHFDEGLPF
ncbi:hypothetical protein [Photobacterium damselae]|uniref:hypothetical protein n=1 Tax=Photobacterium damselae TaxID=38293 RepID=UPI002542E4C4